MLPRVQRVWGGEPSHSQVNFHVGSWWERSPKRTPEVSESVLRGQNSMACYALYINGKLLKCRCPKWARIVHLDIWNASYGQKKARESNSRESASFDSRPLKVGNRPQILGCRRLATYRWKGLDETYNFASDGESIGGLLRKLWSLKVAGVPKMRDFGTLTRESRESRDKMAIWMPPPRRVTEYTIGSKVVAYSQARGVVCQSESEFTRAIPTPKGPRMSSNHFVWFLVGPCEWIKLVKLFLIFPGTSSTPLLPPLVLEVGIVLRVPTPSALPYT
jgi:hypothetical protein